MSKKSFKVKNSISLEETSRQSDSAGGESYYDQSKGAFANKSAYWSFLESKTDVTYQSDITSSTLTATITENAIIKITGSPVSSFNLHGLARNNNAKMIHIYNDTAQKMVIKHQSSTEGTVANRITTPKTADLNIAKKSLVIFYYDESTTSWIVSQTGGGSGGTSFDQVQAAHGFTLFTPIYHNGTTWVKAQANASNTLATYVVTDFSTNAFTATKFGVIEAPAHGLTVGEFYYVSGATAGAITATEPIFGYSNPVIYVQDTTNVHIMAHRPSLIGDGNVSDSEISAIMAFPTNLEPIGFLYADGRAVSRTTYNELFNKIGTMYGQGDNSTTFNLPDLRGQFLRGGVEILDKTFLPAAVTVLADTIAISGHGFKHTGVKVRFSTTSALPAPLAINTDYFVIVVDDNTIKLATTLALANAGTQIDLTDQGTGTHTISQWLDPDAASRYALQNGGVSGNNFGAMQDDELTSHAHTTPNFGTSSANAFTGAHYGSGSYSGTGYTGGNETRPQNLTVGFFIRYAAKGAIKGEAVPAGTMMTFAGSSSSVPNGYLLCDGSSLNRADYPLLFAAISTAWGTASGTTFNLPDTRGLFVRGVDGVAGRDPDKASRTTINTGGNTANNVGSYQADAMQGHIHAFNIGTGSASGIANSFGNPGAISGTQNTTTPNSDGTNGTPRTSSETRPKNVYVNYIIRY